MQDIHSVEIHPGELELIFSESDKKTPIHVVYIYGHEVAEYAPSVDHNNDDSVVSEGLHWCFTSKDGEELFCPVGGDGSMFVLVGTDD